MAEQNQKLADLGEDALVKKLVKDLKTRSDVAVAAGDDCAVIRGGKRGHYLLLKTDCVIEGVHYAADTPPSGVGYKALARAISDIAAMAGKPQHAELKKEMAKWFPKKNAPGAANYKGKGGRK